MTPFSLNWNEPLTLLDRTLSTPEENLALEEALLLELEERRTGPILRLWESPQPFVVLGSSCRVADDVHQDACRQDGIPILRRCSGGGTVLLGPGSLNFTLVLPVEQDQHLRDITAAIDILLGKIATALADFIPDLQLCGTSDLAVGERKISGNAQRWLKRSMLHHGTLLYDFPIPTIARYLKSPPRQPDYRADRPHEDFLGNLPLNRLALQNLLCELWRAEPGDNSYPAEVVRQLVATKYGLDSWNFRR